MCKVIYSIRSQIIEISRGYAQVVRLLLEDGRADPCASNNEAIQQACCNGFVDVVNLLLKDGRANPFVNSEYPLRWAGNNFELSTQSNREIAQNNHKDVVAVLMQDKRVYTGFEGQRIRQSKKWRELIDK